MGRFTSRPDGLAPPRPHARLVHVDLSLQLAQQLGRKLARAAHLGQQLALGLERLDLRLGGLGAVVGVASGLLEPVAQPVESRLIAVAQALEVLVRQVAVLAELVEALERGVREAQARLDLLAPALLALAESGRGSAARA